MKANAWQQAQRPERLFLGSVVGIKLKLK